MVADLRNREILPSFAQLPHEYDLNEDFYTTEDGYSYKPCRHWCLLAEIEEVEFVFRLRLTVRDVDGNVFPIAFHLEDMDDARGGSLDLSQFRKGNTVAIMYAIQHPFLDMTTGIRQEYMKSLKVLPMSMAAILCLNDQLHAKLKSGESKICHTCSQELDKPKKCGACGLALYCTRECQVKAWQSLHKRDCKQLRQLKSLFSFDWYQFDDFEAVPT